MGLKGGKYKNAGRLSCPDWRSLQANTKIVSSNRPQHFLTHSSNSSGRCRV